VDAGFQAGNGQDESLFSGFSSRPRSRRAPSKLALPISNPFWTMRPPVHTPRGVSSALVSLASGKHFALRSLFIAPSDPRMMVLYFAEAHLPLSHVLGWTVYSPGFHL
jgi:hypothetical protein